MVFKASCVRKCIILLTLLLLTEQYLYCQQLYIRKDISNVGGDDYIQENRLNEFRIFIESKFLTDDVLDKSKLVTSLDREIPNVNDSGFLVLNWEEKGMDVLAHQKNSEELEFYINQYISAIKIVKSYRPKLKCAFYSIPYPKFNKLDLMYDMRIHKLADILKSQDFIAPSMYVIDYDNSSKNLSFTRENIEYALKLGVEFNKPVYAFVWHRIHPLNKKKPWQLLSPIIFRNTIKEILKSNYYGRKVNGIFWWHSENNNYSKLATKNEYKNVKNADIYHYDIMNIYYKSIKDLFPTSK